MSQKLLIKKYPNRRLYNTETCRYITLKEVADLIRQNRIIQVMDSETEADLTAATLIRILMNMADKGDHVLPLSMLHVCIQYGQDELNDLLITHLETTLQQYIENRKRLDESMGSILSLGEEMSRQAMDVFKNTTLFPWAETDKDT